MQRIPEKKIAEHIHKAIAAHVLERAGIQRVETAEQVERVMDVLNKLYPAKTADTLLKHPEVQKARMIEKVPEELFRRRIQLAIQAFRAEIMYPKRHTAALLELALDGKKEIQYGQIKERAKKWDALPKEPISINAINNLGIAYIHAKGAGRKRTYLVAEINKDAAEALLRRWKRIHDEKKRLMEI
ncbi:MAG: hypothetical protein GXN93_02720 [Candidatus Diapherotrites archaeon]|nr:hypothetical protein [Candidatus Diapherotrites archaeon]